MPSIRYAHICEYARVDPSGTVSIIGIFDTIQVVGVPANFPFFHVITSLGGQRGDRFEFFTRIAAADGQVLQSAPPVDVHIHQEDAGVNQINGYLGLVFPAVGLYTVEFLINGTVVHAIPFRVVQRQSR
jgi:hypothetical protein